MLLLTPWRRPSALSSIFFLPIYLHTTFILLQRHNTNPFPTLLCVPICSLNVSPLIFSSRISSVFISAQQCAQGYLWLKSHFSQISQVWCFLCLPLTHITSHFSLLNCLLIVIQDPFFNPYSNYDPYSWPPHFPGSFLSLSPLLSPLSILHVAISFDICLQFLFLYLKLPIVCCWFPRFISAT